MLKKPPKLAIWLLSKVTTLEYKQSIIGDAEEDYIRNVEEYYSDYKTITTPLLIIAGEYDILTPLYVQKKLLKIFHEAKFVEYSEGGHMIFMERPKEFFNQVIDFLMR